MTDFPRIWVSFYCDQLLISKHLNAACITSAVLLNDEM